MVEADFALNLAFSLAHKTNQSPKVIAEKILYLTKENEHLQGEITPQGYINIRLTDEYYYTFLKKVVANGSLSEEKFGFSVRPKNSVLLEYVSANPTGYLHLAHFRHAIIGNTLANVYQFLGFQVIREYYINDRGQQINSLVNSVYYSYCSFYDYHYSFPEKDLEYQTPIIKKAARLLSKKYKNTLL